MSILRQPGPRRHRIERAILLLAGRGRRLGAHTDDRPKCMVAVGGVPILERTLRTLAASGIREVVLVVGYRWEQIEAFTLSRRFGLRIRWVVNEAHATTNTAYSLWLARAWLDRSVLLLEGDIVFDREVAWRVLAWPGDSAWAVVPVEPGRDEGILLGTDASDSVNEVALIREPGLRGPGLIYKCAGIQRLSVSAAALFAERLNGAVDAGRAKVFADLVLGELLDRTRIRACSLQGCRWAEVDDVADLDRARALFDASTGRPSAVGSGGILPQVTPLAHRPAVEGGSAN